MKETINDAKKNIKQIVETNNQSEKKKEDKRKLDQSTLDKKLN